MKKFSILALALVLTAALFTGCGCRNNAAPTTLPTNTPTTQATTEATNATTEMTTVPTTAHTNPSTEATIDHGNGPLEDNTTNATGGVAEGRARQHVPNGR